jgi:ribosomal protein S12 methylthiotransferase accessory factor
MQIKDCIKGFEDGIGKVIPPRQTCQIVLKKIGNMRPPILRRYFKVRRPGGIPQYRIVGSDYFRRITGHRWTNGKGHVDEQALASGLMEFAERYSCIRWIADKRNIRKTSSFKKLRGNLFTLVDFYSTLPRDIARVLKKSDLGSFDLEWNQAYILGGGTVYVPRFLWPLLGSNGMAAGNSFEEALLHGICEVVERHQRNTIEMNRIETPTLDINTVSSPIVRDLLKKIAASKKQKLIFKDFSLHLGLPVIGLVRILGDGACAITTGVATSLEEALIRAITENSQTEKDRFTQAPLHSVKHHFTDKKTVSAKSIAEISHYNVKREIESINKLLLKKKMKIFFADTTDRSLNINSVFVYLHGPGVFINAPALPSIIDYDSMSILNNVIFRYFVERGEFIAFDNILNNALQDKMITEFEQRHMLRRIFMNN